MSSMLSYQPNPSRQVRSPERAHDRVCDVTDNMWERLLDDRHEDRRLDQDASDEIFEAEVKPWMRDLRKKKQEQIGTRLVDRKWQQANNSGNRRYIAGMKRKRQKVRHDVLPHFSLFFCSSHSFAHFSHFLARFSHCLPRFSPSPFSLFCAACGAHTEPDRREEDLRGKHFSTSSLLFLSTTSIQSSGRFLCFQHLILNFLCFLRF